MQIPESTTFPAELLSIEGEQHTDLYTGLLYQVKDGVPVPVWEHYSWVGWLLCEALKEHQGTLKLTFVPSGVCIRLATTETTHHPDLQKALLSVLI